MPGAEWRYQQLTGGAIDLDLWLQNRIDGCSSFAMYATVLPHEGKLIKSL